MTTKAEKFKVMSCKDCGIAMDHELVKGMTPEQAYNPEEWILCASGHDIVPHEQKVALYNAWIKSQESPRQVRVVVRSHFRLKSGQAHFVHQHDRKCRSGK